MAEEIPDDSPLLVARYKEKFKALNPRKANLMSIEAIDWFRKRISKDTNLSADSFFEYNANAKRKKKDGLVGKMFLFQYKAEMPGDIELGVYDKYPLVFFFNSHVTPQGNLVLYGLNIHYLAPKERMTLLLSLLELKTTTRYTKRTKLNLTWELIKQVVNIPHLYERAVHTYRIDRIKSEFVEISPMDWGIVTFLNIQKFVPLDGKPSKSSSFYQKSINKKSKKR